MRFFAVSAQFVVASAALGLAFSLSGLPDAGGPVLVVKSAPSISAKGEAAPQPVDLDGDGIDDSAAFNMAALTDEAEGDDVAARPENALVLRLVHIACPALPADETVKAALAPEKEAPWILIAADGEKLPNAVGTRLLVGNGIAEARPVVIEQGDAPNDPAYLRAVAQSCKPATTVS